MPRARALTRPSICLSVIIIMADWACAAAQNTFRLLVCALSSSQVAQNQNRRLIRFKIKLVKDFDVAPKKFGLLLFAD